MKWNLSQAESSISSDNLSRFSIRHLYAQDAFLSTNRMILAVLLASLGYYIGARVGFLLTFQPNPVSTLWPPNAILLAALLLAPTRSWWLLILVALPAHFAAEFQSNVPIGMLLSWFVSNCFEAVIGAGLLRRFFGTEFRLNSFRNVSAFLVCAVFLGTFFSSFLDSALVKLNQYGEESYWQLWRMRFLSNILATLTIVPVILSWTSERTHWFRKRSFWNYLELILLVIGLVSVSIFAFGGMNTRIFTPSVVLYAPLPFLMWSAVRFGVPGISISILIVELIAISEARWGQGLFASYTENQIALSIQLFLILTSIPLVYLSAVLEERRRAEGALRSSEERFSKAFRSSPDAMVIVHDDGKIIEVNDRWIALFGFQREEIMGKKMLDKSLSQKLEDNRKSNSEDASPVLLDFPMELRTKNGAHLQTIVAMERIHIEGELCWIITIHDVTEQRRIESELREQRQQLSHLARVSMLGQLSGALAHELNQPLTAILSNAQAMEFFLAKEPFNIAEIREALNDLIAEGMRAGKVIQRLRPLIKKGEIQFQMLDLNEITREVLDLAYSELITHEVTVSLRLAAGLPALSGDRIQLQQVLLNLIVNATEAMNEFSPNQRNLSLITESGSNDKVHLSISDSGTGIQSESMDQVFAPFFTTKKHGLGLGLSISRSIVREHGGNLWVANNPERGATFHLDFPSIKQKTI